MVLVGSGSYIVIRAVSRELAVARLQSDFVSAVSHEFRTPLTVLRQISEGLEDGPVSDPRFTIYYAALNRATGRLTRLVEQLLDFGRMESGAMPYRLEPVNAAVLAEAVVTEFRHEVARLGFEIELSTEIAATVHADREAFGMALWNLLDNAVKYSPDCRIVWVTLEAQADCVLFTVRDRGVGIDRAEQDSIFQKFVRGERARSAGIRGTGIGLAMVKHIVSGHRGTVALDTVPGEGFKFTIRLPRHADVVEEHEQNSGDRRRTRHCTDAGRGSAGARA